MGEVTVNQSNIYGVKDTEPSKDHKIKKKNYYTLEITNELIQVIIKNDTNNKKKQC